MKNKGNKCGHNPSHPRLQPVVPIRKGKGEAPRILSLAAARAKAWYHHPGKCRPLAHVKGKRKSQGTRQLRSERREALQIIIEAMLSKLELASLCLGIPTVNNGFIDVSMKQ